jgi:branched-chain amino acid transport system permease protein
LSGIAALSSAIQSSVCEKGLTPVATILVVETILSVAATVGALGLRNMASTLGNALREQGAYLSALMLLVAVPFIIAWQTDSSVCARGKSFFWQSIFIEVFILAVLAISYNLMFGFAGVISFGHAAFFGVGAYGVGLLMLHLSWPLGLAILATLLVSATMGLLVSVIALRIRGLYFAIFTLAFAEIFYILAQNRILTDITGAEDGFTFDVPDWINPTQNRLTFYYLALIFLVFCFLLVRQLVNSPTGRVMYAMRDNEERAMMLGYNTFIYKTLAIVLAGILASGAGMFRGLLNKGASPNVLSVSFTIDPLLMTLIGGAGTFIGPVIGAFLLRLVEQFLRDTVLTIGSFSINIGERWALILGLIFILIVIAFPSGIVGTIRSRWHAWRVERRAPT